MERAANIHGFEKLAKRQHRTQSLQSTANLPGLRMKNPITRLEKLPTIPKKYQSIIHVITLTTYQGPVPEGKPATIPAAPDAADGSCRLSAIMLGRLRMSIDQALGQYDTVGNRVFGRPRMLHRHVGMLKYITPKYRARDMEDAVIEVIHEGLPQESSWWARNAEQAPLESDPAQCRTWVSAFSPSVCRLSPS